MDILRVAAAGLTAGIVALYLRKYSADYAMYVSIIAGIMILGVGLGYVLPVMSVIETYASRTSITTSQMGAVFKIIGTAYVAQFAADACRDADNAALASKIEISAKFMIAFFSLPIVLTLFEYIGGLL